VESLEAMFAASDALSHPSTLVEHLIRLATLGQAARETERLLNETQLTDSQLQRLQARLLAADLRTGLTNGLMAERAIGYQNFYHLPSLAKQEIMPSTRLPPIGMGVEGQLSRPADCLMSLELYGETIAASREPFPQARTQMQRVNNRLMAKAGSRNPLEKMKYMVTLLMTPAVGAAFDSTARELAHRDVLLAAIAAERFRLKGGTFPSHLQDLAPEFLSALPIDPFNGQPLQVVAGEGELLIYSVGRDGKNDGGQQSGRPNEPDIVVRVLANKGAHP